MTKSLFIWILTLTFFSEPSFGADLKEISNLFKNTFWNSHYEEGKCGVNVETLVRKSMDNHLDLSGAQILEIKDESGRMFGLVSALVAREGGRFILPRQTSPTRQVGPKNWYFHAVLLVNGHILDYDFTNEARILPLKDYLSEMFIPVNQRKNKDFIMREMKGYEITSYPAEDYILRRNQRLRVKEIGSTQKLTVFAPHFFNP